MGVAVAEKKRPIAELPIHERVEAGIEGAGGEQEIADYLSSIGHVLMTVSPETDMNEKIDRILIEDCVHKLCQIKFRDDSKEEYRDFLFDVYEPFYGRNDSRTKVGRDKKSPYDLYICRINKTIFIVDGARTKELIDYALKFWEADAIKAGYTGKDENDLIFWYSRKTEGLQVKRGWDPRTKKPKLLVFIPPALYAENQIRRIEME